MFIPTKEATSSQTQCPVFKRLQRHIGEWILTTTNLFFMEIPWKCVEKLMNPFSWPWKQRFSDFMVLNCVMKFLWNSLPVIFMKSLQSHHEYGFSWVMKVSYSLDRYISWPMKRQLQPSMYFMGDEISNGPWNSHKGTIKNPWKCPTHSSTKVDVNALEKCCTHLLPTRQPS